MDITLVRHGQTTANEAGVLQGQGQSSLTERGRWQAESLAARIDVDDYDVLLVSDLDRALETAEVLGGRFVTSPAWREVDLGTWEGLTWPDIQETHTEDLDRLRSGEDVRFGGAESLGEFAGRVKVAVDELAAGQGRALVVTHGGVINEAVKHVAGVPVSSRLFGRSANTALTRMALEGGRLRLAAFNDARHIPGDTPYLEERLAAGGRAVFVVPDATDPREAAALRSAIRPHLVVTSRLGPAYETAMKLDGSEPVMMEELSALLTGETLAEAGARIERGVASALSLTERDRIAVVCDRDVLGAYLGRLLGLYRGEAAMLSALVPGCVSTIVFSPYGTLLADFNVPAEA